jgi:hypothetical protein
MRTLWFREPDLLTIEIGQVHGGLHNEKAPRPLGCGAEGVLFDVLLGSPRPVANNYDHVQQNDEGKDEIQAMRTQEAGGADHGSERA